TLLIQRVALPGGGSRYVVQLADRDLPRARDVSRTLRALVPSGSAVVLVGRGAGAVTAMDLAADRDFTAVYAVSHLFAVGAPADARTPADPRTRVHALSPSALAAGRGDGDGAGAAVAGRVTAGLVLPLGEDGRPRTTNSWSHP
ncbi:hypothetical protein ACFWAO_21980, partial [Streptomyces sp. NPDC059981]